MDPRPSHDNNNLPRVQARRERQRIEILGLVDAERLHRAADLTHHHLAEFPEDRCVRCAVIKALDSSADPRLRRRAGEFPGSG